MVFGSVLKSLRDGILGGDDDYWKATLQEEYARAHQRRAEMEDSDDEEEMESSYFESGVEANEELQGSTELTTAGPSDQVVEKHAGASQEVKAESNPLVDAEEQKKKDAEEDKRDALGSSRKPPKPIPMAPWERSLTTGRTEPKEEKRDGSARSLSPKRTASSDMVGATYNPQMAFSSKAATEPAPQGSPKEKRTPSVLDTPPNIEEPSESTAKDETSEISPASKDDATQDNPPTTSSETKDAKHENIEAPESESAASEEANALDDSNNSQPEKTKNAPSTRDRMKKILKKAGKTLTPSKTKSASDKDASRKDRGKRGASLSPKREATSSSPSSTLSKAPLRRNRTTTEEPTTNGSSDAPLRRARTDAAMRNSNSRGTRSDAAMRSSRQRTGRADGAMRDSNSSGRTDAAMRNSNRRRADGAMRSSNPRSARPDGAMRSSRQRAGRSLTPKRDTNRSSGTTCNSPKRSNTGPVQASPALSPKKEEADNTTNLPRRTKTGPSQKVKDMLKKAGKSIRGGSLSPKREPRKRDNIPPSMSASEANAQVRRVNSDPEQALQEGPSLSPKKETRRRDNILSASMSASENNAQVRRVNSNPEQIPQKPIANSTRQSKNINSQQLDASISSLTANNDYANVLGGLASVYDQQRQRASTGADARVSPAAAATTRAHNKLSASTAVNEKPCFDWEAHRVAIEAKSNTRD